MTADSTTERLPRQRLETFLRQTEQHIAQAEQRLKEHAQLMGELKKDGHDWRVSDALHTNLRDGLRLLLEHRSRLLKELGKGLNTPAS